MKEKKEAPAGSSLRSPGSNKNKFTRLPQTRTGWWAVWLAAGSLLMPIVNLLINLVNYATNRVGRGTNLLGMPVLLLALASGVTGLVAVTRKSERSWLVWISILLGVGAVVLMAWDLVKALIGR